MLWIALALTPIIYGIGDFFAGQFAKNISPWAIVGFTSGMSAISALGWTIFTGNLSWDTITVLRGIASGALYLLANALFYVALSRGKSAIVGSIIALSVIPAVFADFTHGELPSALQLAGTAAVVIGVIVISVPESIGKVSKSTLLIAVAAAMVFGIQYVVLGRASVQNPDIAIFLQYATAFACVGMLGLFTRKLGGVTRPLVPKLLVLGVAFGVAGLLLSTALSGINVAVVSSVLVTEPIMLAIMGYFFAKQKLLPWQIGALVVVIAGAVVASAG